MDQKPLELKSYEDLLAQEGFQESLAFHPKADRRFDKVLWPYQFLDLAPCGISSCRQKHLRGYLVQSSDGLITNIGNRCGLREFGVDFTRDRKRVDDLVAQHRREESIRATIRSLPTMITELEQIEQDYKLLSQLKNRLFGALDMSLFQHLKARANRDETTIKRMVRRTQEEMQAYLATNSNVNFERDRESIQYKEEIVAVLEGLAFIRARFKDIVDVGVITPLRNLQKTKESDIPLMTKRELMSNSKWIGELPAKMNQTRDIIAAGWRFFTRENIMKLKLLGADSKVLMLYCADLPK